MTQFSQPDYLGTPKIIFISRGTSAFEYVIQARKRRASW